MDRRIALTLGLVVLVAVVADVATELAPNTWIERDGRFYVNVNENLLDEQSLQDPFAHSWYDGELGWNYELPASFSNIALGRQGEYWHFRPYLLPILSTPFYWAFGLIGVLLFNLLLYGVIAAASYRFARAWAGEVPSALAAVGLVMASGVRVMAYNYAVDVLLLALFMVGLAALVGGRALWTGLLLAAAVTIKPPTILYALPLALILWERRDWRGLRMAILGGAIGLGLAGLINWYMYGRPWWFGYNRALVVVQGEQQVFDDVEAFVTPLDQGARALWSGPYGVRDLYGIFLLAIPGLARLAGRSPRYVVGSVAVAIGMYVLFSKFAYQYDRFLFPAFGLLVPALAAGIEVVASGATALARRLRASVRTLPALAAALLVVTASAVLLSSGAPLAERMGDGAWATGAVALGDGAFDLREVPGIDERTLGERSIVTRTRFDTWVPRTSPLALVVAAPFTAIGGHVGLLLLHLIAAGVLVWSAVRLLERIVPPVIAAGAVAALALLPPLYDGVLSGGPDLLAAATGTLALHLALARRWASAAALALCAAWLADAPWLGGLAVLGLASRDGRPALVRTLVAAAIPLALWGVSHLILYGRPFASPDDFVVVGGAGGDAYRVATPSLLALFEASVAAPGPGRAMILPLLLAPLGVLVALRERPVALVLLVGVVSVLLPGVAPAGDGGWSALAWAGLALPLVPLAHRACEALADLARPLVTWRRAALAVVAALAVLALIGGVRRGVRAAEPWHMTSWLGVRHAEVTLDDIPCDFLAWENMSWECAHFDGGVTGRAGLALPARPSVDGAAREMWLVPSGRRGRRTRHLRWTEVPAAGSLLVRYGSADGYPRDAIVRVSVEGSPVDEWTVPTTLEGIEERRIDTSRWAGEEVDVHIEVAAASAGAQAAVALDGWFE